MTRGRRSEPRIVDPETHPRRTVCLRVAAEYLEIDERTLKASIDDGGLEAFRLGKVYRIELAELVAYRDRRRSEDTDVSRETA